MLRRGILLFGFVVAALLASAAAQPGAQAATITLTSAGPSQARPGQPATFDFDWMLHPTIGIDRASVTFTASSGNGSVEPRVAPLLTLSNASNLGIGNSAAPLPVARIVQVHVLPLPSGGLLLLTALVPLAVWSRRQRGDCSPSQ